MEGQLYNDCDDDDGDDMEGHLSNDGRSCERQSGCSSSAEYSTQSCLILSGTHNSNPLFLGVAFYG